MDAKLQLQADLVFLALTTWREARGESMITQLGVAHAILNRVRKPAWWGTDVMSVVFKKWQFSSMTDPHDPQLTTWPRSSDKSWQQCLDVAADVLSGATANPVPGADSYYDISIKPPVWAVESAFVGQLGKIRFYNLDNDHERSSAIDNASQVLKEG